MMLHDINTNYYYYKYIHDIKDYDCGKFEFIISDRFYILNLFL